VLTFLATISTSDLHFNCGVQHQRSHGTSNVVFRVSGSRCEAIVRMFGELRNQQCHTFRAPGTTLTCHTNLSCALQAEEVRNCLHEDFTPGGSGWTVGTYRRCNMFHCPQIAPPTAGDCSSLCLVLSINISEEPGACFHCTLKTRSPLRDPQILNFFDGLQILNVPFTVLSIDAWNCPNCVILRNVNYKKLCIKIQHKVFGLGVMPMWTQDQLHSLVTLQIYNT
jgi:hypothetical protein